MLDKQLLNKQKQTKNNPKSNKSIIDRNKIKSLKLKINCNDQIMPDVINYILMKERFQQIYKKIERLSHKEDYIVGKIIENKRFLGSQHQSYESSVRIIHPEGPDLPPEIFRIQTSHLNQKLSLPHSINSPHKHKIDKNLSIITKNQTEILQKQKSNQLGRIQHVRKTSYRKKILEPLINHKKLSNNISDYLNVGKIDIKQVQEHMCGKNNFKSNLSYLLSIKNHDKCQIRQNLSQKRINSKEDEKILIPIKKIQYHPPQVKKNIKFKNPFQLYYYRDFMWKVGYSNNLVVQPCQEYESKIKYYVGPGNNSNLIKGIMKRRSWFAITDKIQEATFAWTQIKSPSYFLLQNQKEQPLKSNQQLKEEQIVSPLSNDENKQKKGFDLFNFQQKQKWQVYWKRYMPKEIHIKQNLRLRSRIFQLSDNPLPKIKSTFKIHNHFINNFIIGNKKALFSTMTSFYAAKGQDVFNYLPLTFHIKDGLQDQNYLKFLQYYYQISKDNKNQANSINKFNAWIIKPGENTNRGNGIIVCLQLNEIKTILKRKQKHHDGTSKTYILQKYIQKPLLYKRRKFDLRHYMMLNCSNGIIKGYWYKEGYVRTTSSQYTLKIGAGSVHLTNDAVQKHLPDYGKYQKGNKISYQDLDSYLKKSDPNFDFWQIIYPKMKKIATDSIFASALTMDPCKKLNNFEIFGLDFMIDQNYNVWLIEINTNPCLQTTCPVLNKIIPRFIQNTLQICIDPIFPAPLEFAPRFNYYYKNMAQQNNFQLVFDQRIDKSEIISQNIISNHPVQEDDIFDDDGEDFDDQNQ